MKCSIESDKGEKNTKKKYKAQSQQNVKSVEILVYTLLHTLLSDNLCKTAPEEPKQGITRLQPAAVHTSRPPQKERQQLLKQIQSYQSCHLLPSSC
jgi:hypothetical protein